MSDRQLAQVNISNMRAPLEDKLMKDFASRLDDINRLADVSPGFVWRLQTEDGDATALHVFDDPLIIINLTVWNNVQALRDFVFRSQHRELLLRRREWMLPIDGPHLALWWVPTGHRPDVDEAKARLKILGKKGPSAEAFTFSTVPVD